MLSWHKFEASGTLNATPDSLRQCLTHQSRTHRLPRRYSVRPADFFFFTPQNPAVVRTSSVPFCRPPAGSPPHVPINSTPTTSHPPKPFQPLRDSDAHSVERSPISGPDGRWPGPVTPSSRLGASRVREFCGGGCPWLHRPICTLGLPGLFFVRSFPLLVFGFQ